MRRFDKEKTVAIIVAAGKSRRMRGVDKVRALLAGRPLLSRVVDTFQDCPSVDEIVIVVRQQNLEWTQQLASLEEWSKVTDICAGGPRRQDSVLKGISRLEHCDWAIIQDGARPLVTVDLIERGIEAARETGAAVAAVPAIDTVKLSDDEGFVRETMSRRDLWLVQTPQVFRFDIVIEAFKRIEIDVTDDASLVERAGYKVKLYMGSYDNIKITTPDDLALAEILWQKRDK